MNDYVLEVGGKGFDRLKFIKDVFGVHSRNFLKRAGLCFRSARLRNQMMNHLGEDFGTSDVKRNEGKIA